MGKESEQTFIQQRYRWSIGTGKDVHIIIHYVNGNKKTDTTHMNQNNYNKKKSINKCQ